MRAWQPGPSHWSRSCPGRTWQVISQGYWQGSRQNSIEGWHLPRSNALRLYKYKDFVVIIWELNDIKWGRNLPNNIYCNTFLYKDFICAFVNPACLKNQTKHKTIICDVQVYQFYEESGYKMRFLSVLLSISHWLGDTRCKINSLRFFFYLYPIW